MKEWPAFAKATGIGLTLLCAAAACSEPEGKTMNLMTTAEALAQPRPKADHIVSYGGGALQFGELRLPVGDGPHPVVIVIHGGCWLAEYDLGYISGLAQALTDGGVATWSIEYRRVGDDGGGWPGTFRDVADAADSLRSFAADYNLDLDRVAVVGHSAGGHLALWLAGRRSLDPADPLRGESPIALNGVVALAGITDLRAYASPEGCGAAVPGLLGGDPSDVPGRLERTSPIAMVPLGVAQVLVIGELDPIVPGLQATSFADAARLSGDEVEVIEVRGAGHFELVGPTGLAFATVQSAVMRALEARPAE